MEIVWKWDWGDELPCRPDPAIGLCPVVVGQRGGLFATVVFSTKQKLHGRRSRRIQGDVARGGRRSDEDLDWYVTELSADDTRA